MTTASTRPQFSSRLGFVMAATGSAVGLGNIWGFPTQTAENGGAAFVLAYCVLAFVLAYPALMAELVIGRHRRANIVSALGGLNPNATLQRIGSAAGLYGVVIASLILAFYSLVGGWMIAHTLQPGIELVASTVNISADLSTSVEAGTTWLTTQSPWRDIIFCSLFMTLTAGIVAAGVGRGIERWSTRLMPTLIILMIVLMIYVWTLEGAGEGLRLLLVPDVSRLGNPSLLVSAMGQAFFSLSLGVGTMLIYGSYINPDANLPTTGAMVTAIDMAIALLAGLLIIPAIFAAQHLGIVIYDEAGVLRSGPGLIFQTLPALFNAVGTIGQIVASGFFALLTIAALTSSISMLEVPVAYLEENHRLSRHRAVAIAGLSIFSFSVVIAIYFNVLFGAVVNFTTEYSQPLLGIALCVFAGWVMRRDHLLDALGGSDSSLFNRIWPWYVRFICPLLIAAIFIQNLRT